MWQDAWSLSKQAINKVPMALLRSGLLNLIILFLLLKNSVQFQHAEHDSGLFQYETMFTWIVLFFQSIYIVGLGVVVYTTSNRYFAFNQCSHRRQFQFLKTLPLRGESIILSQLIYLFVVMVAIYLVLIPILHLLVGSNDWTRIDHLSLLFLALIAIHLFLAGPFLYLELNFSINRVWLTSIYLISTSALVATIQTIFEISYLRHIIEWVKRGETGYLILLFLVGLLSIGVWFLLISSQMKRTKEVRMYKGIE